MVAVGGLLFFGESLTAAKVAFLAMIIVGVVSVAMKKSPLVAMWRSPVLAR